MILRTRLTTLLNTESKFQNSCHASLVPQLPLSAWLSGLCPGYLPVDDGLPVGVHRLADLDGDLDFKLPTLVVLHLLADLLRVEVGNVDNLMLAVLVAEIDDINLRCGLSKR